MSCVTLDRARSHLRLAAVDDTDGMVQVYLDAAEDAAAQFLNRSFYVTADALAAAVLDGTAGIDPIVITPSIVAAVLLTLGLLYEHREDVVVGTIAAALPMGARTLLQPYRAQLGV